MRGNPAEQAKGKMTMYTTKNFPTKKAFKQAVEAWNAYEANPLNRDPVTNRADCSPPPRPVTYFQPGPFGGNEPRNGVLYFEGPHYPKPHRWYAQAVAKDGVIIKVK
jgi:hypothetical protein